MTRRTPPPLSRHREAAHLRASAACSGRTGALGFALVLVCLLAACAGTPPAQAPATEPLAAEPDETPDDPTVLSVPADASVVPPALPFESHTLDNGLTIVTLRDASAPIVAVQVWYHVGSKDEDPERTGFAHLFEHMMFRGTPRLGPAEHMEHVRATGGSSNAFTSFDETVYVQEVPADQLELVLWLESERMAFLRIDPEGFAKERDVVAEEYRKSAEQPYGSVASRLLPDLFEGGTYSWLPIGELAHIDRAPLAEIQRFWETYYTPNNTVLVVVGDVEHDAVVSLAERYFAWIPRYDDKPSLTVETTPPSDSPRTIEIQEKNGPAPIAAIAWRTVEEGHSDEPALSIAASILGGEESGRLYQRLVVEDDVAMFAIAAALNLEADGLFAAGAVLSPLGGDVAAVTDALRTEVARLRDEGPSEAEVTKARNRAVRGALDERATVASKASLLGRAAMLGQLDGVESRLERLGAVSADDVKRAAQTWLSPEREIAITVEPSLLGFVLGGADDQLDLTPPERTEEPVPETWGKPGLERPADLPETPPVASRLEPKLDFSIERATLDNGLRLVVVPSDEVPRVSALLAVPHGAAADPAAHPGTAWLAANLAPRGSLTRDYETITEMLGVRAIDLGGNLDMDDLWLEATAVSAQAPAALELLADVARNPVFDDAQLALLKKQYRTGRTVAEASPDFLASRVARRSLYGDGHPYGRDASPELDELDGLDRETVAAWWAARVRPDQATLFLTGAITLDEARALAEAHFGDWTGHGEPVAPLGPSAVTAPKRPETRVLLLERDVDQAQIRVVAPASIRRSDAAWADARVLSQVFGGGSLSSWLNRRIRGDEGLTYGAYGGFRARRLGTEFRVSTFSKVESTVETVTIILEEIQRLTTAAADEADVARARDYLVGNYVLQHETPSSLIAELYMVQTEGLGDDWVLDNLTQVAGSSADAIRTLAEAQIDPARLTIVVVGPASLAEPLGAIGPVTRVDPLGAPIEDDAAR